MTTRHGSESNVMIRTKGNRSVLQEKNNPELALKLADLFLIYIFTFLPSLMLLSLHDHTVFLNISVHGLHYIHIFIHSYIP